MLSSTFSLLVLLAVTPWIQGTPLVPHYGNFVPHESRIDHPEWRVSHKLEGHVNLPLRFGLKQQNLDNMDRYLLSVSDPDSPTYGQHWDHEKVVRTFAPLTEAHASVRAWLIGSGVDPERLRLSSNKAWIHVEGATISEAENLLNTEYHVFKHTSRGEHVGCHGYSLPAGIVDHVDMVSQFSRRTAQPQGELDRLGQTNQRLVSARASGTNDLAGCNTAVVPSCLKTLYNMTYTPKAIDKNTFGIVSLYSNNFLQSDLDTFFRNFSPSLVGTPPNLVSIDGGTKDLDANSDVGEDGWALEYAMTLVQPQTVSLLQVGNNQTGQIVSFNEWLDAVDGSYCTADGGDDFNFDPHLPSPFPGGFLDHSCGTVKAPNVVSSSQADHESRFTEFYLKRQCNEFAKLGLMGVTVVYSAGNTGVSGAQSGYCLDENGSSNLNATRFNPAWPASCPWVTVVGGTQVKANATSSDASPEEVWNQNILGPFFKSGGGGFSNRFPSPSYQTSAVRKYFTFLQKTHPERMKSFNVKGRAYPDLSANANSFVMVDNGAMSIDSGTSGATPTVASIITLVNDARIAAGRSPSVSSIQWFAFYPQPRTTSPTILRIYSSAFSGAFNDITVGTSQGCKGRKCKDSAMADLKQPLVGTQHPVLETPNLGRLIDKWLALP